MSETTIDGFPVEPGMLVWDYDLNPARVVGPLRYQNPAEATWYEMARLDGSRSSAMDAKRMWVRHPSTGARVTPQCVCGGFRVARNDFAHCPANRTDDLKAITAELKRRGERSHAFFGEV